MSDNATELPEIVVTGELIKAYEESLYAQADEKDICCPLCGRTDCKLYKNKGIPFLGNREWAMNLGQFGKRPKKLSEAQKEQIILEYIVGHENDIEHMYLDSNGFLTVGIGTNIHRYSDDELAKLPFTINGRPATRDEILNEARRVRNMPKGYGASHYKSNLRLNDREFRRQAALDHMRKDREALRNIFPDFDKYSINLQKGLHDMIYNLGMTGFKEYKQFIDAVKNWDFVRAANQSARGGIGPQRNAETKTLFLREAEFMANLNRWRNKRVIIIP